MNDPTDHPDATEGDSLSRVLWESVEDKGIRGRLYREDCDYLARVAREHIDIEAEEGYEESLAAVSARAHKAEERVHAMREQRDRAREAHANL